MTFLLASAERAGFISLTIRGMVEEVLEAPTPEKFAALGFIVYVAREAAYRRGDEERYADLRNLQAILQVERNCLAHRTAHGFCGQGCSCAAVSRFADRSSP